MSGAASFGMLFIRGIVGAVMIAHGSQKLFGWFDGMGMKQWIQVIESLELPGNIPPLYLAYGAAISEFGGGILLILGFLTPVGAIAVAATMGVAAWKVHFANGFFLGHTPDQPDGMEYALTLALVALGLVFTGAGKISLDGVMPWGRSEKKPKSNGK